MLDVLAWFATILAFLAYIGVSIGKLNSSSILFLGFNLFASSIFVIHGFSLDNYSAVAQNIFFTTFSALGLLNVKLDLSFLNVKYLFLVSILSIFISLLNQNFQDLYWIFHVVGWPAVCFIVGAYILYTQNRINTSHYFLLNVFGNLFLTINLIYFDNYQFAALQIFSFIMGVFGFYKINKDKKTIENLSM